MISAGRALLLACVGFALGGATAAGRSNTIRAEFIRAVPCPETGVTRGACPGWEVDHVVPLCAGGADRPENMQWLTVAEHKAKTRQDVRGCRAGRGAAATAAETKEK